MATLVVEIEIKDDEKRGAVSRVVEQLDGEDITSVNWKDTTVSKIGPIHRSREALDGAK